MTNAKSILEASPVLDLLARKESGAGPHPLRPLDHLAYAIMLDGGAEVAECLIGIARLREDFVDWNEIRVARTQELARVLGRLPNAERAALRIKEDYNAFFDKKGALGFDFLSAGKPAEMRRALVQMLPHLPKGATALLLYEFCPGASLPLSDDGLKQARKDGIAGKSMDRNQLSRHLLEAMEPEQVCLLLQHWELAGAGNPYGEAGGGKAKKKAVKPATRAKAGQRTGERKK